MTEVRDPLASGEILPVVEWNWPSQPPQLGPDVSNPRPNHMKVEAYHPICFIHATGDLRGPHWWVSVHTYKYTCTPRCQSLCLLLWRPLRGSEPSVPPTGLSAFWVVFSCRTVQSASGEERDGLVAVHNFAGRQDYKYTRVYVRVPMFITGCILVDYIIFATLHF